MLLFCVVFFFFKPKTAYEMRISDWSSDVCSSDLVLNGELVVGELKLVGHALFSMMASASISTFHSGRSSADTTTIVAAGRIAPNTAPCARPTRRSEEHTSELQSLMRISYAAFCLKTKNKHTLSNQPHTTATHRLTR